MYIDTHAHLTMPEYSDLQDVLDRAKDAKIEAIVNASFDIESSKSSVCLTDDVDFIYAAIGVHPQDAELLNLQTIAELKKLAENKKVVAIGETGLDYFHMSNSAEVQIKAFRDSLSLAQELDLPVIIHCRDSQADVMRIVREENKGKLRAVFHCFAGDNDLIDFCLGFKFMISFTGNITFKKADLLRERVVRVPLTNLMIETDCPYLAPTPFRGQRNEPAFIYYIAAAIAEIKGVPLETVAYMTTNNAREFFKIPA